MTFLLDVTFVVCAAILAFVLRGFRKRQTTVTAVVLTCACAVRQQAADRHLRSAVDWGVLGGAVATPLLWVWLCCYHNSVADTTSRTKVEPDIIVPSPYGVDYEEDVQPPVEDDHKEEV